MEDNKPTPKPTRNETAVNLLRLGQLLHQYSYPLGDLGLTRPLKPDEAERLREKIVALERRIEASVTDLRQWVLRGVFGVRGQEIVDPLVVRIIAYVAWSALASERPDASVARVANAVAMKDLALHLEARRTVRQMLARETAIHYLESDISEGLTLSSRAVKYLSGEGNLGVLFNAQSIQEEKAEWERRNGDVPKKAPHLPRAETSPPPPQFADAPTLLTAKGIFDALKNEVIAIDVPLRRFSAQMSLHMRRLEQIRKGVRPSVGPIISLILGSSGSGKTHLAETFARVSGLPFTVADMSGVSQASYVGLSVDECFYGLLANKIKIADAQKGIVVLDEFDKLCAKGGGSHSSTDPQGRGIQAELLKPLEGCKLSLGSRRSNTPFIGTLDTYETNFILAGAFQGLRELLADGNRKSAGLGFGSAGSKSPRNDIREALVRYGFMEQIVSRIGAVIVLADLIPDQIFRITTHPETGLLAKQNAFLGSFGLKLILTEEALRFISNWACETRGYSRSVKTLLGTLIEGHLMEDRKGDIQISLADVKRAIEETEGTAGLA